MEGTASSRRRFLGVLAGAAALSLLPRETAAMGRARWSLLPPRPVPWIMKPLSSARTWETSLPDGRVELRIEHDVIRGVTPSMFVWWISHIEGEMDVGGRTYPRYLVWHPIDHIHYAVEKPRPDGGASVGAKVRLVEALGANPNYLVNRVFHIRQLGDTGAVMEVPVAGRAVMRMEGRFTPAPDGMQLDTTMTVGLSSWVGRLGLNRVLLARSFPPDMRRAWLKHNVEEMGNLEFFLPDLYRRHQGR